MNNKKLIIALIAVLVLAILGVAGYFLFGASSPDNENTDESAVTVESETETSVSEDVTADTEETTAESELIDTDEAEEEIVITDRGEPLESYTYRLYSPENYNDTDSDRWTLKKFTEKYSDNRPTTDEIIATIDDGIANQMPGNEYGFVDGFYYNDCFYTSIISDKVLKINKLDLTKDEPTYDAFVDLPMPEGYELSGLWEGERLNNDDYTTILYMNDENIYFHVIGESYTEDIYLYRIEDQTITKLDSSFRTGPHSMPRLYKYDHYLILLEDSGYYVIDETVGDVFETVLSIKEEQYTGGVFGLPSIKDGELYFSYNPWSENHVDYKYNFETKALTKAN